MLWLNILDNETVLLIAETLFMVIGSMLLGILLSHFYWGGARKQAREALAELEKEKSRCDELREQIREVHQSRSQLQSEIFDLRLKNDQQSKTIYDHQQYIFSIEADHKNQKATIDSLNAAIDSYQQRLQIIVDELEKSNASERKPVKTNTTPPVRANYEHVSALLGRQVTENDLTLITGIGPKTASLLQSHGIRTWEQLADTPPGDVRRLLDEAGGIYKSQDSGHWGKQAKMAARGEWRKLRVFQESLRKTE